MRNGAPPAAQSLIGWAHLFTGRPWDSETRQYYYRYRWYDPHACRWLSLDPIGYAGGLVQYAYCGGNPVNFLDPWGKSVGVCTSPPPVGELFGPVPVFAYNPPLDMLHRNGDVRVWIIYNAVESEVLRDRMLINSHYDRSPSRDIKKRGVFTARSPEELDRLLRRVSREYDHIDRLYLMAGHGDFGRIAAWRPAYVGDSGGLFEADPARPPIGGTGLNPETSAVFLSCSMAGDDPRTNVHNWIDGRPRHEGPGTIGAGPNWQTYLNGASIWASQGFTKAEDPMWADDAWTFLPPSTTPAFVGFATPGSTVTGGDWTMYD